MSETTLAGELRRLIETYGLPAVRAQLVAEGPPVRNLAILVDDGHSQLQVLVEHPALPVTQALVVRHADVVQVQSAPPIEPAAAAYVDSLLQLSREPEFSGRLRLVPRAGGVRPCD